MIIGQSYAVKLSDGPRGGTLVTVIEAGRSGGFWAVTERGSEVMVYPSDIV